jgi:hypothetical protein
MNETSGLETVCNRAVKNNNNKTFYIIKIRKDGGLLSGVFNLRFS